MCDRSFELTDIRCVNLNLYITIMKNNYPLTFIAIATIATTTLSLSLPSNANPSTKSKSYPTSGKVLTLTNGDLMCYVELIDTRGKKHNLGANFDICQETKLLNKRVKLTYQRGKFSDCQSAEPCGKTRIENMISKMKATSKK